MTNAMMINNEILTAEQLDQVAGGTFDGNMYSTKEYNAAGVTVDTHFFSKDDFFIMSAVDMKGNKTALTRYHLTYDAANAAVEFYKKTNMQPTIQDIANAVGKDKVLRS